MKKKILITLLTLLSLSTYVMADDNINSQNNTQDSSASSVNSNSDLAASSTNGNNGNNGTSQTSANSNGLATNGGVISNPSDTTSNNSDSVSPVYAPIDTSITNSQQAISSDKAASNTSSATATGSKMENALHVSYIYGGFIGFGLYCSFPQDDLKLINDRYNYLITQMHLAPKELKEAQKAYILDTKFSKTKGPAANNMSCSDFRRENDTLVQYIKLSNQNGMKSLFVATQLDPATDKPTDASSVQANIEASQKSDTNNTLWIILGVVLLAGVGYSFWKKYY